MQNALVVRYFLLLIAIGGSLLVSACADEQAPAATTPEALPSPTPPPTPRPEPPAIPVGLRVSERGETFIEWAWTPVAEVTGYDVQFSDNEAFTSEDEVIRRTAEQISYRRAGLRPGETAYLRVRSAAGTGAARITSAWSTHITGMTAPFPAATIVNPEPPTFPLEVALPEGECAFTVDEDGRSRMNKNLTIRTDRHAGLLVDILPPGSECCTAHLVRLYPGRDNRPFANEIPHRHDPGGVVFEDLFGGETRVGKLFFWIFEYTDESFAREGGRTNGLICEPFYCHVTAESARGFGRSDPLLAEVQRLCG